MWTFSIDKISQHSIIQYITIYVTKKWGTSMHTTLNKMKKQAISVRNQKFF